MRKFLFYLLLFTSALTLPAGSYYSKLGKYSNVTILKVDHNGIQISHSYGICYITEKDLSPAEKYRLNRQLQLHKEKITKHEKSKQKNSVIQLRKLQKLADELPEMSKSEIESWALREVKVNVIDPQFKDKFMEKFSLVGDNGYEAEDDDAEKNNVTNKKVLARIFDRLKEVSEESIGIENYSDLREQMVDLADKIPQMSLNDIEKLVSKALGCKLYKTDAINEWTEKFKAIDYQYKLQLTANDDAGSEFNEDESCEVIFKKLLTKARELQQQEIEDVKKRLAQGNDAINEMMHKKLGVSVGNDDFEVNFNAKYCLVENNSQIARMVKLQVRRNEEAARRAAELREYENRQALTNFNNSRQARRCANCAGSGRRSVYVYGAWRNIRCNSCNGSGDAGFAADYLDSNGRRHRSVMEQNLGRMMGAF